MTPKKKARELFDKYYLLLTDFSENSSIDSRRKYAKDFAIIAVDEILELLRILEKNNSYYLEVKHQIEKL
jgi:hypothetical protein